MNKLKRVIIYSLLGGIAGGLIAFTSLAVQTHHYSWKIFFLGFVGGILITIFIGFEFIKK